MMIDSVQDYWDYNKEEHMDTRHFNQQYDNSDPHLGCNLGIDVAG